MQIVPSFGKLLNEIHRREMLEDDSPDRIYSQTIYTAGIGAPTGVRFVTLLGNFDGVGPNRRFALQAALEAHDEAIAKHRKTTDGNS